MDHSIILIESIRLANAMGTLGTETTKSLVNHVSKIYDALIYVNTQTIVRLEMLREYNKSL